MADPSDLPRAAPASPTARQRPGRAWRAVIIVTLLVAVGLVALDVVPRHLMGARQVTACGVEGLEARIAPAPIPWQVMTGGLRAEVPVPPEAAIALVERRLSDTPLVDPEVSLVDGAVKVNGLVDSPLGRVPVELLLEASADGNGLTFEPVEVWFAGRQVSGGSSGPILGAGPTGGADTVCSTPTDVQVMGVNVTPNGVTLTVAR